MYFVQICFSHIPLCFCFNRVSFRRKKKEDKKEDVAPKKTTPKEEKVSSRSLGNDSFVTTEGRPSHPLFSSLPLKDLLLSPQLLMTSPS